MYKRLQAGVGNQSDSSAWLIQILHHLKLMFKYHPKKKMRLCRRSGKASGRGGVYWGKKKVTWQSESAHDLQVSDKSGRDGGRYNLKDESLKCSTGEGNKQGKPRPFFPMITAIMTGREKLRGLRTKNVLIQGWVLQSGVTERRAAWWSSRCCVSAIKLSEGIVLNLQIL